MLLFRNYISYLLKTIRKMKHITIKEVAEELGVSISTVSRALNDKYDIKQATKDKIVAKAKEMGYAPNPIAQKLQQKKSNNIGVVVPEFRNAFFPDVITGIQDIMLPLGYQVLIMQSNESAETELSNVKTLYNNMVDGLIISFSSETQKTSYYKSIIEQGFPIVQFNRVIDKLNTSKVVFDDYAWAFMATEHLILQGYKNIIHLKGPKHLTFSISRAKGFEDAMKKHKLFKGVEYFYDSGVTIESGKRVMKSIIAEDKVPDAIFAVTDPVALGAMIVMKEHDIQIPKQVGVVGFSESRLSEVIQPSLTTIKQPTYEMGQAAAKLLIQEIETNISIPHKVKLSGSFKIKQSSVRIH
ncbi:LacI family DNA-binding transcriptional regulator [Carboxylicivirga sp. RSCT41]|uniref:LacI family DNA-binding transcriptional regulator n=1 Tax=Carboxylicivirga agarovorans TaxID=3417570 RepID=UPI003D3547AE